MLQIFAAVLWITFLCWHYGYLFIHLCRRVMGDYDSPLPHVSIVCLAGLSVAAIAACCLSLLLPLGPFWIQILLLLPLLLLYTRSRGVPHLLLQEWKKGCGEMHWQGALLCVATCILFAVMGAHLIIHSDTIGYHTQTIRWIEAYRVVPGLVHLNVRYGYQGNWYVLSALFGFRFTGTPALLFVNQALACWYVLFIAGKIGGNGKENKEPGVDAGRIFYLLLLAWNLADFGQLRLLVSSASPDFAAAIWVLATLFVFTHPGESSGKKVSLLLAALLAMVAVTIKLSSLPLLLLCPLVLYRLISIRSKAVWLFLVTSALIFIPFVTRHVITSGYAVFPSPYPDLFHPEWKYDRVRTEAEKRYIMAYARIGDLVNRGEEPAMLKEIPGWMPVWWKQKKGPEKLMLLGLPVLLLTACSRYRRFLQETSLRTRLAVCAGVAGVLFWWVQAPDPRFAYGFLLGLEGLLAYPLAVPFLRNSQGIGRVVMAGSLALTLAVGAYTVYRFQHFFKVENLYRPDGVKQPAQTTTRQDGLLLNMPGNGKEPRFRMRGSTPEAGFMEEHHPTP